MDGTQQSELAVIVPLPTFNAGGEIEIRVVRSDRTGQPELEVRVPGRKAITGELSPLTCGLLGDQLAAARSELIEADASATFGEGGEDLEDSSGGAPEGSQDASGDSGDPNLEEGAPTQPDATGEASEGEPLPEGSGEAAPNG